MDTLTIHVDDRSPQAYAFERVIRFRAEIDLLPRDEDILVDCIFFDPSYEGRAPDEKYGDIFVCICNGANQALAPMNLAATIRVYNFLAHPVDFDTERCTRLTRLAIAEALAGRDDSTIA